MLSKQKIKLIHSLERKKNRDESGFFLAEGNKLVEEALFSSSELVLLVCTNDFAKKNHKTIIQAKETIITDKETIRKASLLKNPQEALAIVRIPTMKSTDVIPDSELCLALDCIQDPGNLGTIFRIADWFGIKYIICSEDTVDAFNPKVVQSSMGAIFRIETIHTSLSQFLSEKITNEVPVYGTFLDGTNIYEQSLSSNGIIVMGNEGNGISSDIEKQITQKLFIPSFSSDKHGSESLNVAIATAICCSEFRRR